MKIDDLIESFDPIRCLDVDALIGKIIAERSKYPAGSLSPREVICEMTIPDISREEAEKIADELTKEIMLAFDKFHDRLSKKKK